MGHGPSVAGAYMPGAMPGQVAGAYIPEQAAGAYSPMKPATGYGGACCHSSYRKGFFR